MSRAPVPSAEARLLLLCAAGPEADARIAELLREPIDWAALLRLAMREDAVPVVRARLARLGAPAGAEAFEAPARVRCFTLRRAEREVGAALGALEEEGIRPVLLKGAALAATVYGGFADRPMGDADLLVAPSEADAARARLLREGWEEETDADRAFYHRHHHLPPLRRGVARLELHLRPLAGPLGPGAEEIRVRARTVARDGRSVRVPDALDLLVHLSAHFAWSHALRAGAWRALRDVRTLAGADVLPWERLPGAARDAGAATACFWTLRLARRLAGAAVPAAVEDELRPPLPAVALDALERHYAADAFAPLATLRSEWLRRRLWEAGMRPRASGHGAARPWTRDAEAIAAHASLHPLLDLSRSPVASAASGLAYLARLAVDGAAGVLKPLPPPNQVLR